MSKNIIQDALANGIGASVSYSDLNTITCPECFNNHDIKITGTTFIDNIQTNTYLCPNNHIFVKTQGGVSNLTSKIQDTLGPGHNVGITIDSIVNTSGTVSATTYPGNISYTPNNWNTLNDIQISSPVDINPSSFYQMEKEIRNLRYSLDSMIQELRTIVIQNNKLQEQLATDPLIGMRDKINNFNLK